MKGTQKIILIVFIVVFPLVSYLYLKRGFDVRKTALDALKEEIAFTTAQEDILHGVLKDSTISVLQNVFILHRFSNDVEKISQISQQLQDNNKFHSVIFYSDSTEIIGLREEYNNTVYEVVSNERELDLLFQNGHNVLGKENKIRKVLSSTNEAYKKLYEYTVILLPLERREEVELQRKKAY